MEWGTNQLSTHPTAYTDAVAELQADDLATIIYTSGTTGEPKGAMLTHDNIVSNVKASFQVIQVGPKDTSLSFLPLCHIFERMGGLYGMLYGGVTIAYAENIETVAANVAEVRPTVLTGVPRFYEKVFARIMEVAAQSPPPRRKLFSWGLNQGIARARARFAGRGLSGLSAVQAAVADALVGKKIRARMGGRLRFAVSGGAPLNPKVLEFFYAIGIPVVEGYGLTETSPVICLSPLERVKPGSVGPAIPGVEMKLGEQDEIMTRGPHVMQGYFENEEATKAAFADDWFRTGDIGRIDEDGYLFITDRLKQLLVTAGGKKVAPQPIEAKLKEDPLVTEVMLIGDRLPFIACLFFPNFDELERLAKGKGVSVSSRAELIAHPETQRYFQELVDEANQALARYEQIKNFAVLEGDLSLETGELTPTLKIRRKIVHERFEPVIEELYRGHETPGMTMEEPVAPPPPPPAESSGT